MQMSQIRKQTGTRTRVFFRACVKDVSRPSLCMSCLCSLGAASQAGLSEPAQIEPASRQGPSVLSEEKAMFEVCHWTLG